jgi:hypothetical protein
MHINCQILFNIPRKIPDVAKQRCSRASSKQAAAQRVRGLFLLLEASSDQFDLIMHQYTVILLKNQASMNVTGSRVTGPRAAPCHIA